MYQIHFWGTSSRTPWLGELTMLSRPPSRLAMVYPLPNSTLTPQDVCGVRLVRHTGWRAIDAPLLSRIIELCQVHVLGATSITRGDRSEHNNSNTSTQSRQLERQLTEMSNVRNEWAKVAFDSRLHL